MRVLHSVSQTPRKEKRKELKKKKFEERMAKKRKLEEFLGDQSDDDGTCRNEEAPVCHISSLRSDFKGSAPHEEAQEGEDIERV